MTCKHLKSIFKNRVSSPEGRYNRFAVLAPIVKIQDKLKLLFEVRSKHLKNQPTEICFPGGKMEDGESPADCAIRETCEELNILPNQIEIFGPLDYLVMPYNIILYPFLGDINSIFIESISFNKDEVSDIFTVPLDYFINNPPLKRFVYLKTDVPEDFPFHMIQNGKNYNWKTGKRPILFYSYKDRIIWGITARIIKNLVNILLEK